MGIANAAVNAKANNDKFDDLVNEIEKITVNQLELDKAVNELKQEPRKIMCQKKRKMETSKILSRVL